MLVKKKIEEKNNKAFRKAVVEMEDQCRLLEELANALLQSIVVGVESIQIVIEG